MRHRKHKFRLNRSISLRRSLLNVLSRNLLIHQSIRTTVTKAKATRPLVERLIVLGKKNTLDSRRKAFRILQDHKLVQLLFSQISPQFKNKNGGYIRIIPYGFRRGDGAKLVILELTKKREVAKKAIKKEETQPKPKEGVPEAPIKPAPVVKKPAGKFLGGLRKIFKKEGKTPT